jgi:hypothetical protein
VSTKAGATLFFRLNQIIFTEHIQSAPVPHSVSSPLSHYLIGGFGPGKIVIRTKQVIIIHTKFIAHIKQTIFFEKTGMGE